MNYGSAVAYLKSFARQCLAADSLGADLEALYSFLHRRQTEVIYCPTLNCWHIFPCATHQGVARVESSKLTSEDFLNHYELPAQPVVLLGLAKQWRATEEWQISSLAKGPYRNSGFRCATRQDGIPLRLKLKYFLQYMQSRHESLPGTNQVPELYVFDPTLGHNTRMLKDYQVPDIFKEDLFSYAGSFRPPFRWILIGPAGTGSLVHIDPLGTSAWNTLLQGTKKWVLLPPSVPANWVKFARKDVVAIVDDESATALDWFTRVLPSLTSSEGYVEFDQQPGETVFIPAGWWHAVLNLSDTVAVTQNFASSGNFQGVWEITCTARPELAQSWLEGMQRALEKPDSLSSLHHIVHTLSSSPIQPSFASSSFSGISLAPFQLPVNQKLGDIIQAFKVQQGLRREWFWESSGAHSVSLEDLQQQREEEELFLNTLKQILKTATGTRDAQEPGPLLLVCSLVGEIAGEAAECLLEAKASPDAREAGHFALGIAAHVGEMDSCRTLLKYGSDVKACDVLGRNALILAAEAGADAVAKLLLGTRQLDINCRDFEQRTPLIAAAENGRDRVIGLLLQRKAKMDLKDAEGRTAEQASSDAGFFDCASTLASAREFGYSPSLLFG